LADSSSDEIKLEHYFNGKPIDGDAVQSPTGPLGSCDLISLGLWHDFGIRHYNLSLPIEHPDLHGHQKVFDTAIAVDKCTYGIHSFKIWRTFQDPETNATEFFDGDFPVSWRISPTYPGLFLFGNESSFADTSFFDDRCWEGHEPLTNETCSWNFNVIWFKIMLHHTLYVTVMGFLVWNIFSTIFI
jgi:hypothetical protein